MSASTDISGQRFGKLVVLKKDGVITSGLRNSRRSTWLCKCDCGNETVVVRNNLTSGTTKSCGCLQHNSERKRFVAKENLNKARRTCTTHGMSNTRIYRIWKCMIDRCNNSKRKVYKHYGGRGIKVCEDWMDLKSFCNWALKNGYDEKLEIDRIDNDGNYEPSNCRWATRKEQTNNERRNIKVEINGEEHTLAQWSDITGIVINTLQYRYHRGDRGERLIRPVETKYRRTL